MPGLMLSRPDATDTEPVKTKISVGCPKFIQAIERRLPITVSRPTQGELCNKEVSAWLE